MMQEILQDDYAVSIKDVLNCLCNPTCNEELRWCDDGYCPPVKRIMALKPVEPQRKTGTWIKTTCHGLGVYDYECSECKTTQVCITPPNYCPDCGAQMIKE